MTVNTKISEITHPEYTKMLSNWYKWRIIGSGGQQFIDKYLRIMSKRESMMEYYIRKAVSYAPAHAKAAVMEIKNAIYQRMSDIKRMNGTQSYKNAIIGRDKGVDLHGNSMNGFIGRIVLPELLFIAKVGVYVDREMLPEKMSLQDTANKSPYLYIYHAEDIRSWRFDKNNELVTLLLRDNIDDYDERTGLVTGVKHEYRLLTKTSEGVFVQIYDGDGNYKSEYILNLKQIPFVLFQISNSLLSDIADHQIALLNLASADMSYALRGNFPFYVEQYDPRASLPYIRQAIDEVSVDENGNFVDIDEQKPGEAVDADRAKNSERRIGVSQGVRYPIGTEKPSFINPSAEPLRASMEKQSYIKEEIRQLINLSVTMLIPTRQSAESKREDLRGLESGLSYIGMELEYGERQIAEIWLDYENSDDIVTISYPNNYSIRTDEDRRKEADDLVKKLPEIPSKIYRKEIAKEVAEILLGQRVTVDVLDKIRSEIDASEIVVINPNIIEQDFNNGFVSTESASRARGYPRGEVEQAKKDHAERLARINAAQIGQGARGNSDLDPEPKLSGSMEKQKLLNQDDKPTPQDPTRGEGK